MFRLAKNSCREVAEICDSIQQAGAVFAHHPGGNLASKVQNVLRLQSESIVVFLELRLNVTDRGHDHSAREHGRETLYDKRREQN